MKTKLIMPALMALAIGVAAFGLTGCSKSEHEHGTGESPAHEPSAATKYNCPMHPDVVQDKPGNCPKCGMALVEKR